MESAKHKRRLCPRPISRMKAAQRGAADCWRLSRGPSSWRAWLSLRISSSPCSLDRDSPRTSIISRINSGRTDMAYHGNVLVVDDDALTREFTAMLLKDMGYCVKTAESADDALRWLYSDESFDVVLADIIMPGMSGVDLWRMAEEARPGVPVVLISGNLTGITEAMEAGKLALTKPIRRERLSSVLCQVMDHGSSKPYWRPNSGTQ
jgi:CheY-like chemotaxis protein